MLIGSPGGGSTPWEVIRTGRRARGGVRATSPRDRGPRRVARPRSMPESDDRFMDGKVTGHPAGVTFGPVR